MDANLNPSSDSLYMFSTITYIVWNLNKNHKIGYARLVRYLGEDEGENASTNDVILLYLDAFLIM